LQGAVERGDGEDGSKKNSAEKKGSPMKCRGAGDQRVGTSKRKIEKFADIRQKLKETYTNEQGR